MQYSSSLYAEVTKPQDALPIGDTDGPDVALWPVLEDVVDVSAVMDSDEKSFRALNMNDKFRLIAIGIQMLNQPCRHSQTSDMPDPQWGCRRRA